MEKKMGVEYLSGLLEIKRKRVLIRYGYYESKEKSVSAEITIPKQLRDMFKASSGWCTKAVDSLADRLMVRGIENDGMNMMQIFEENNPDVLFDSAILGALIAGCNFISLAIGENGSPRLEVIDAANATGIIDRTTGLLTEGYAVIERNEYGQPTVDAYYEPFRTTYRYIDKQTEEVIPHTVQYPLLVPVIFKPDARRPLGHSRITRACMYYQDRAKRTRERMEVSSEFYSTPQKYVLGLSEEADDFDTFKATISTMLDFRKDEEDGSVPSVGQFTQQSMSPFIEQMKADAADFAGETGLTLDDLGYVSQNPSSAEAIKASHETLRLIARKAQKKFASGFINAGYLGACLRDGTNYTRTEAIKSRVMWEPIFEPDMAALGLIGDGVQKINTAVPGYITEENLRDLTGIKSAAPVNEDF